ncbi:MAG: pilus assembly protein N-terminal domain-containing protein [Caulobacterales bacterium]|jgi:Flp pilus assembly secretin CpaC|nr:pilus assembly protein N-terminal domain-containing protein [Caulobacterales bacterium]
MRAMRPLAAIAAAALVVFSATPAFARDIRVALDQAFPIRLVESAEGVAIGNPSIAGVSVQNDRFLFVTGRSYGSTNLVVVGANGRVLYSGRVVVTPDETDVVMVTRGNDTARLECTPLCRPRPDIGDGAASTEVAQQITNRASAATAGGGGE